MTTLLLCPVFVVVVVLFCVFTWGLGTEVRISLGQEKFLGVFRIISLFWAVYLDAFPRITVRLAPDTSQIKPKEFLLDAASLLASFLPMEWGEQYGFIHPRQLTRPSGILENTEGGLGFFTCCLQAARVSVNLLKPWTKAGVFLLPILQWIHEAFIRMTWDKHRGWIVL